MKHFQRENGAKTDTGTGLKCLCILFNSNLCKIGIHENFLDFHLNIFEVLIWWRNSSEEALPWSPMATEKDRANMIILSVHGYVFVYEHMIGIKRCLTL